MAITKANPRSGGLAGSDVLLTRLKRIAAHSGCGGGDGFSPAVHCASRWYCGDLSEEMIVRAQQAALDDGVAENSVLYSLWWHGISHFTLEGAFDLVLFHAVLEWIADRKASELRELTAGYNSGRWCIIVNGSLQCERTCRCEMRY